MLKQNAAIVGDAVANCKDSQCWYKGVDKLRLSYAIKTINNGTSN